jgi:hypothetical protein
MMSGGGARAEAVLRGACGADEVRPLLTRLRMICEGGLTRMVSLCPHGTKPTTEWDLMPRSFATRSRCSARAGRR